MNYKTKILTRVARIGAGEVITHINYRGFEIRVIEINDDIYEMAGDDYNKHGYRFFIDKFRKEFNELQDAKNYIDNYYKG